MPSPIPQYRIWDDAKAAKRKFRHEEAIKLYRSVEQDMRDIQAWRADRKERDNLFDQTLFLGDYLGALADAGLYAEAEQIGELAIKLIEENGFRTLKYIYYNMGSLYLFQKEYERSLPWYEVAMDGQLFYTKANSYLVNCGIALYCLERIDEAKEKFLLAIESGKGTKYNKSFEPFFFMMKICKFQCDETQSQKYKKMYLSRLKKYSRVEIEWAVSTMEDGAEILTDYEAQEDTPCNT